MKEYFSYKIEELTLIRRMSLGGHLPAPVRISCKTLCFVFWPEINATGRRPRSQHFHFPMFFLLDTKKLRIRLNNFN
jgi:hypothetical protein